MTFLFIAAIIPVIALCYFIYVKDVNREPGRLLAKIFALGFFSSIPVVILELVLSNFFSADDSTNFILIFVTTFITVGIVEEGFKWIITKIFGYNNKEFDEVYDIIVYSVFASLGFACIENILYVIAGGMVTALFRALLSVPGHTCFAVIMGYFLSQAKVNEINENKSLYTRNMILSILIPTLVHTMYDALLMYIVAVESYIFILIFIVFDIAMVVMCFIRVNKTSKIQQNLNKNVSAGTIVSDDQGYLHYQEQGTKEINFCPVCGKNVKGFNFCPGCGFKLK